MQLGWDPNKDPKINLDPSGGFHQFSHTDIIKLLRQCAAMSWAPTDLYKSMEILSKEAGLIKEDSLRTGPGTKELATQILDTRIAIEEIILDILNQLYVQATSLDITINILRREEHQEIRERSLDLLDSDHSRILRFVWLRK